MSAYILVSGELELKKTDLAQQRIHGILSGAGDGKTTLCEQISLADTLYKSSESKVS